MNNEIRKGLIYFRVSTEEQVEFGVSLEYQEKTCYEYAKRNGIEIFEAFHDDGVSAKTTRRDGLQDLLAFCKKNYRSIDCLIVYKIDRLTRSVNDYGTISFLLNKLNIRLISVTEAIDNTPTGKYVGNLMAAFAQLDNEVRSERVSSCMNEIFMQGFWCWDAPIGYLNTRNSTGRKTVTQDPERAPLIKLLFEEYSTGLYTLEEVRKMINKKGLRTKKGNAISKQNISKIISRKFYCGTMELKGVEQKGKHEPIITEELFYKCQKILKGYGIKNYSSKNKNSEDFPLRHFAICGCCGRPLTASFSSGKSGRKFPYYRCYNSDCPSKKSIAKDKIEKEFVEYLKEIAPNEKYLKCIKPIIIDVWRTKYKEMNGERTKIERDIEGLKKEKTELIAMKKRGLLSDEDFLEDLDKIKNRITDKHIKLEEAKIEDFDIEEAIEYVFGFISKISRLWEEADFKSKVKIQSSIFPEKVVYQYNGFETPNLSLLFQQKKEFCNSNSLVVASRGIEPLLPG